MATIVTARGVNSTNTAGQSTLAISPTGNLAAGSTAVLGIAYDNSGTNGADPYASISDNQGNKWLARVAPLNDPGAANAGLVVRLFDAYLPNGLLTSDTITVSFGGITTVARAWALWEVVPNTGYKAQRYSGNSATGTSAQSPNSGASASMAIGEIYAGFLGAAYGTTEVVTLDGDTTRGNWSAQQVSSVGSTTSGMTIASQCKITASATGSQTYNPTIGTGAVWAIGWSLLQEVLIAQAGSFTLNATIKAGVSGSFTLNGLVKATRTGSLTLDALIKSTVQGSLTLNAVIQREKTGTFTLDAVIAPLTTALITQQSVRVAVSPDAVARVTQQAVRVAVVPTSALARTTQQSVRVAISGESVTTGPSRTGRFTLDAVTRTGGTGSFTLDAVILAHRPADAYSQDSFTGANNTVIDGHVPDVGPRWAVGGSAYIFGNQLKGGGEDDALMDVGQSDYRLSVDVIGARNVTYQPLIHFRRDLETGDTWVLGWSAAGSWQLSLISGGSIVYNSPAIAGTTGRWVIVAVGSSITVTSPTGARLSITDSRLATNTGVGLTPGGNATFDNWLVAGVPSTFTLDAIIGRTGSGTFSLNSIIRRAGSGTFTLDATVRRLASASFTLNATVFSTRTGSFTLDASITGLGLVTADEFTLDSTIRVVRQASFGLDAIVSRTQQHSFSTDAVLRATRSGTFTLDASIRIVRTGEIRLDAVIRKTVQSSFTAQAVILAARTAGFALNAVVLSPRAGGFTLDAQIIQRVEGSLSLDAIIQREGVGSFTLEAIVATSPTGSLALDAIVRVQPVGSFQLDAWVRRVFDRSLTLDAIVFAGRIGSFRLDAIVTVPHPTFVVVDTTVVMAAKIDPLERPTLEVVDTTRFMGVVLAIAPLTAVLATEALAANILDEDGGVMPDPTFVSGDTAPAITAQLFIEGSDPLEPVDLTDADVAFQMRKLDDRRFTVNQPADIVAEKDGKVSYDWGANDLATPGEYQAQWRVTFPDYKVQTQAHPSIITVRRA